jgi:hypothetical protein
LPEISAELPEILVELPKISAELPGLSFGTAHDNPISAEFGWRRMFGISVNESFRFQQFLC